MIDKLKETRVVAAAVRFRRAVVAALTVPVLLLLHKAGVAVDHDTVQVLIDGVVVAGVVYVVPSGARFVTDPEPDQPVEGK